MDCRLRLFVCARHSGEPRIESGAGAGIQFNDASLQILLLHGWKEGGRATCWPTACQKWNPCKTELRYGICVLCREHIAIHYGRLAKRPRADPPIG